jgi:hypothetical protein
VSTWTPSWSRRHSGLTKARDPNSTDRPCNLRRPGVDGASPPSRVRRAVLAAGFLINEQPFLALWWLLSATTALWLQPNPNSITWWLALGMFCAATALLALLALRTRRARPVLSDAF